MNAFTYEARGLRILALPTTYAGSEMTPIRGLTENGVKNTGRDARVLPRTVIHDPELKLTLPLAPTVSNEFNAIAHAAEGLYAQDANPIVALMAEEGIRAIAAALAPLKVDTRDIGAAAATRWPARSCAVSPPQRPAP